MKMPMSTKICPLGFAGERSFEVCHRHKCAWWNDEVDACAVLVLSTVTELVDAARDIAYQMNDVVEK